MSHHIGIIGRGNVGQALARGFERIGLEAKTTGHDAADVRAVAQWADVIILAVPFRALDEVMKEGGAAFDHKVVVDVSNTLDGARAFAQPAGGSGAEQLQKHAPRAKVVKAFNTVFAQHMSNGKVGETPLSALVASDDEAARKQVCELASLLGFDAVDAGPLANARYLEALGYLNIQLGYVQKLGPQIGFRLARA